MDELIISSVSSTISLVYHLSIPPFLLVVHYCIDRAVIAQIKELDIFEENMNYLKHLHIKGIIGLHFVLGKAQGQGIIATVTFCLVIFFFFFFLQL